MSEPDSLTGAIGELVLGRDGTLLDCSGPASEEEIAAAEKELGVTFPNDYRAFLRHYGTGCLNGFDIFGLPSDRLWGDVVMMNQLASRPRPAHLVKVADDTDGYGFYLDIAQMDDAGECPVVVLGAGQAGYVVAESFLEFLRKVRAGLL